MELILIYIVFALSTTILVFFSIFKPVVQEVEDDKTTRALLLILLTIAALLFAPFMFVVCFVPGLNNSFVKGLTDSLKTQ